MVLGRKLVSLEALRRQTSGRVFIAEIDGLRFLAIFAVVLCHIATQVYLQPHGGVIGHVLSPWFANGRRGVRLFFVISGFILCLPFARHYLSGAPSVRLRSYFVRRLTRLEPPYMVWMLLRAALILAVMHGAWGFLLPRLLATLLYVHSLIYGQLSVLSPPVWSLEVEVQFYCVAPILAWVFFAPLRNRWLRRGVMLSVILACSVRQYLLPIAEYSRLGLSIVAYLQYFLAGFLLCDLYLDGWENIRRTYLWDLLSAALLWWTFVSSDRAAHLGMPIATLLLYVGAFKGPVMSAIFRNPVIATLGGMCYSIYLTHNLVLTVATRMFSMLGDSPSPLPLLLVVAVNVVLVFGAGFIYYALLERPCMERDWPYKLWNRAAGLVSAG
jgi:peptidoglycan/LPS O-acetylase OafA/YrhL